MKNINWHIIRLIAIFAVVIFLYAFATKRNETRKLKNSEVIFVGNNNLFVKQETVNNMLIDYQQSATTIKKENLDLLKLEKTIDKQPMIEKSQVFVTIDGVLKADPDFPEPDLLPFPLPSLVPRSYPSESDESP